MLFLHSFLNLFVFLFKILKLFIGLPQLLLMQSHVHILISLHLLILIGSSINLKFEISVLYDKFIALIFKLL